jgi:translation initiation factor IF-1
VDSDGPGSARPRAPVARAVRLPGVVVELLPSAMYRIRLDDVQRGQLVLAHVADRIDRNFVRVLVGDRVHVELSPADAGRGRIVEKL